jgi:signal transduction histidine kinase
MLARLESAFHRIIPFTADASHELRTPLTLLAVVAVEDSGIGIAVEDLPYIFERFYRADNARSRERGGAGLGLSIARWIAQTHCGQIQVESVPGQGSKFQVSLPLLVKA